MSVTWKKGNSRVGERERGKKERGGYMVESRGEEERERKGGG